MKPVLAVGRSVIAALATAMLVVALAPASASASSSGCAGWSTPKSCVRIIGVGTFVDKMGGGVRLDARQSTRGYHVVWGGGLSRHSTVRTYWNQSWWNRRTFWVDFGVGRRMPAGTRICSKWVEIGGDGFARPRAAACKTVQG